MILQNSLVTARTLYISDNKEGINIWGVNDLLALIDVPFTGEEFFKFMNTEVAEVLRSKGL